MKNKNEEPDWEYMELYIKKGFDKSNENYNLITKIHDTKPHYVNKNNWQIFKIGDRFNNIVSPKVYHTKDAKQSSNGIPYVIRTKFNNGGINRNQEIKANNIPINIEVSAPMTREEIKRYIKKLQLNYPIDYQELKKKQINAKQFILKYSKGNYFNEPFKLIPIIDKFKIVSYALIEVTISPINIINFNI